MQVKRVVNIFNFVRAIEPRIPSITPEVLLETTSRQIDLVNRHNLPATFALQYDALIDPGYQALLRGSLDPRCEIAAWWEIVQPLVEKAGIEWRGRFPWDWHADVGFSTGYSPEDRERLVDVYMADFRDNLGYYPRTVGSWFIDTHSLAYMADRYGIAASCNCKDQIGTDGYTLWGGYWNQGYYPSRRNAYLPAQDEAAQIPVPVFRMLGSDPIYQYDSGLQSRIQGVITLEPTYSVGGGDPAWVDWFLKIVGEEPCLAFSYAQAGQENSFTWNRFGEALSMQVERIAKLAREEKITVETMEQTGKWFRNRFKVTPATAVTATDDWKGEGRKTVWYNSRYYRVNMLWEHDDFRIRDIHLFDQGYADPYLVEPLRSSACEYDAPPLVDGFNWSGAETIAGIRVVDLAGSCGAVAVGAPDVRGDAKSGLAVFCSLAHGGRLEIRCGERVLSFRFVDVPRSMRPALAMTWQSGVPVPFVEIGRQSLKCIHKDFLYKVVSLEGRFEKTEDGNVILMVPDGGVFSISTLVHD